jgi:Zn-dependent peptidase ImmA (M78 family)
MSLNLQLLGDKLRRYREQFQLSLTEVSTATGINENSLQSFENGNLAPSGDEILILSDFYKCDYKFFISNEQLAPFEQTETLFRRFSEKFSKQDRWAVQEFLFLAECESFLQHALDKIPKKQFIFNKQGGYYKGHAESAALNLRKFFGYTDSEVPLNIFKDFRSIGIHIFRRRLENSDISGLFIKHPIAGKCSLVNYSEDIYRQRFTAAHEAGHAILDGEDDFVVSFTSEGQKLQEVRANTFASRYLIPPVFLRSIPNPSQWDSEKALEWANKLKVSTQALAYALAQAKLIDNETEENVKKVRVSKEAKIDPEIPASLSPNSRTRMEELLERGLSRDYVNLCFAGYREGVVSAARLGEMLLVTTDYELRELAMLFGESLHYDA